MKNAVLTVAVLTALSLPLSAQEAEDEGFADRYATDPGIQGCLDWHQAVGTGRTDVPALLTVERPGTKPWAGSSRGTFARMFS